MIIAIDHGNYAIKTPNFSFVAGYVENDVMPAIQDETIKYNDKYYSLTEKRFHHMRDKTVDDRYFILTLFAIGKELEKENRSSTLTNVDLAVGLPPEHYGTQKDKFSAYFKKRGPISFTYNNKQYYIEIQSVAVYPQAYAAIVLDSENVLKTARIYVVDIGGYTMDVMKLLNGKPDMQVCKSLDNGIIKMNNTIISHVNVTYDMQIDDEIIKEVLLGEPTQLPDEVVEYIRNAAMEHTNYILSVLKELDIDVRVVKTVFLGGGSALLKPYIQKNPMLKNALFIDDRRANAIGYKMLAEAQMAAKRRKEG